MCSSDGGRPASRSRSAASGRSSGLLSPEASPAALLASKAGARLVPCKSASLGLRLLQLKDRVKASKLLVQVLVTVRWKRAYESNHIVMRVALRSRSYLHRNAACLLASWMTRRRVSSPRRCTASLLEVRCLGTVPVSGKGCPSRCGMTQRYASMFVNNFYGFA
jgi:hypothetical protein